MATTTNFDAAASAAPLSLAETLRAFYQLT